VRVQRQKSTLDTRRPDGRIPAAAGHDREWLDACKGGKTKPGANFEFSSLATEALHLGNISLRTGERLVWDRAGMKVTNAPSVQKYIQPERRKGWSL
jgi:hypothetical protein